MTSLLLLLIVLACFAATVAIFALLRTRKALSDSSANLSALKSKSEEVESRMRGIIEELKKENKALSEKAVRLEAEKNKVETACSTHVRQIANLRAAISPDSFDGLFPICSSCKDIRDPKGYWHSIEEYIQGLSEADFSHSLCPTCAKKLYPELFDGEKKAFCLKWNPGSDTPVK